ncbi:hypothetical protein LUX57_47365 [Actinomadura madurae]|uniref:hypothetical protein n=1 Tax=Actinomadura madurae TaxID=1993 RepID=UPI0020D21FF5|nr:hypothetical protein [Actinomadura madurae]MCP9971773.1 hypothetical protein [Actinomadura madurae]
MPISSASAAAPGGQRAQRRAGGQRAAAGRREGGEGPEQDPGEAWQHVVRERQRRHGADLVRDQDRGDEQAAERGAGVDPPHRPAGPGAAQRRPARHREQPRRQHLPDDHDGDDLDAGERVRPGDGAGPDPEQRPAEHADAARHRAHGEPRRQERQGEALPGDDRDVRAGQRLPAGRGDERGAGQDEDLQREERPERGGAERVPPRDPGRGDGTGRQLPVERGGAAPTKARHASQGPTPSRHTGSHVAKHIRTAASMDRPATVAVAKPTPDRPRAPS